jgi:porin
MMHRPLSLWLRSARLDRPVKILSGSRTGAVAGLQDANPNPLHWIVSCGIGGNSPLRGREADRFGIGWYYGVASPELGPFFNPNNGTGMEMFYNMAVTRWFQLTPDLQIINGGISRADTADVFGLRGNLIF